MNLDELHVMHRRHLLAMRRSHRTVSFYYQGIVALKKYLDTQGIDPQVHNVTRSVIQELQIHLRERGIQVGGEHAIMRALRATFKWAEEEEIINKSPMSKVKLPKLPRDLPPAIQPAEVELCLRYAKTGNNPLRDQAIMLTLLDCGLRQGELIALKVGDVDLQRGLVTVRPEGSKGENGRVVPIGIRAGKAVHAYIQKERRPALPFVDHLFLSRGGEPLTRWSLSHLMSYAGEKLGIPRSHTAPHAWRRAFAIGMLRGGSDVFSLQQMMGHSTLEMTRRYLRLLPDDLQRIHLRASPADRL